MSHRSQEILLPPAYWGKLSQDDKNEFTRLRANFHQSQKMSSKDSRLVSFSNELHTVLKYIEHSEEGRECRTILTGVAFGRAFICVNTRQLKCFLGRCKSSINGSFQQLGYVAIKTKSKARACILAILPSLINDQNILRQWTVRFASDDAKFCYVTSLTSLVLPIVTNDDLNEEHKSIQRSTLAGDSQALANAPARSVSTAHQFPNNINIQSLTSSLIGLHPDMAMTVQQQLSTVARQVSWASDIAITPEMPLSYSLENFPSYDSGFNDNDDFNSDWNPMLEKSMTRSQSASFANDTYNSFTLDYSMF